MARRTTKKAVTPETGINGSFDDTEYKESSGGYDGPPPPVGLYPGKLTSVGQHTTSDDSIVWTFDITEGKYQGWRGWIYTNMSSAKWKTQDILVALGLIEPNGEINQTYEQIMQEAQPVRLRVIAEEYGGDLVPKLRTVLKAGKPVESVPDEEDDEEDEDFKKEEKKPAARRSRAAKKPDPEPEPEDEGEDEEEGEGLDLDALEEELEDMDLKGLKAKAKEFGLSRAEIRELGDDEDALVDAIMDKAEEQNPPF